MRQLVGGAVSYEASSSQTTAVSYADALKMH